MSFVTASEKLIDTVNQQRLELLFFGDRTRILPYPNSAEPLKEAVGSKVLVRKISNLLTALGASLKSKSSLPIIDSYSQSTLTQEQHQTLMEWLFARKDESWVFRPSSLDLR